MFSFGGYEYEKLFVTEEKRLFLPRRGKYAICAWNTVRFA